MQPLRQINGHFTELKTFPDAEKVSGDREQLELMNELIESLNLELTYTNEQLQETEEELRETNYELSTAFIASESLPFDEAKKLAQKLLASQKSAKECLAELLSAIYGLPVESQDLDSLTQHLSAAINGAQKNKINSLVRKSSQILDECNKLRIQVSGHQQLVERLALQCDRLQKKVQVRTQLKR